LNDSKFSNYNPILFRDLFDKSDDNIWKDLRILASKHEIAKMCQDSLENGKYSSNEIFKKITRWDWEMRNKQLDNYQFSNSLGVNSYPVGWLTIKEWVTVFQSVPEWLDLRYLEGTIYLDNGNILSALDVFSEGYDHKDSQSQIKSILGIDIENFAGVPWRIININDSYVTLVTRDIIVDNISFPELENYENADQLGEYSYSIEQANVNLLKQRLELIHFSENFSATDKSFVFGLDDEKDGWVYVISVASSNFGPATFNEKPGEYWQAPSFTSNYHKTYDAISGEVSEKSYATSSTLLYVDTEGASQNAQNSPSILRGFRFVTRIALEK
jgi:hypothetical protein